MVDDKAYWKKPVGAPSDKEVETYASLLRPGRVLLLGCTEKLLPMCNTALDLQPVFDIPKIVQMNWLDNKEFYTNIIGDGVLNLDKDLCHSLILMASTHCEQLIIRSFSHKLEGMKYACYFPGVEDFSIRPSRAVSFGEFVFFVWMFE